MKSLACGESRVQGMICYEMFSSILGWSWQLYVALEFCSVLHITYYTVVLQQLYCIVLWLLLGLPHTKTPSPTRILSQHPHFGLTNIIDDLKAGNYHFESELQLQTQIQSSI